MKKRVLILGCSGSIGRSALDCIRQNPDKLELAGLSTHTRATDLLAAGAEFNCKKLCLSADTLRQGKGDEKISYTGQIGLKELILQSGADIVLNGISGAAGLTPSITALNCGIDLALANKETMVIAGKLIKKLANEKKRLILPVDSEHSALFNLIEHFGEGSLESVVLTASGGPFKNTPAGELHKVSLSDALKHPTWNMGKKITIDSATLANKGLEVIEACRLFNLPPEKVQVVVHPQSLVHSLIRTRDGVLYGQISKPDMRHPILNALLWPDYEPNGLEQFDITSGCEMTFIKPRFKDFPLLSLAYESLKKSASHTIVYNAANEAAVDAFLKEQIGFTRIASVVAAVLEENWPGEPENFEQVWEIDLLARRSAEKQLKKAVFE